MTLTENAAPTTPVDVATERSARRLPITDVGAYLDELPDDARAGLRALGDLLVGVTQRPARAESADRFTARCLGVVDAGHLVDEDRDLNPVSRLTTAVALAEWITAHADAVEIGSGEYSQPPSGPKPRLATRLTATPSACEPISPPAPCSPTLDA